MKLTLLNTTLVLATLSAATGLALVTDPPQSLKKVEPRAPVTDSSASDWAAELATSDLDARERTFARLVDEARFSRELQGLIHTWAGDTSRPELAWTSRLALRELRSQRGPSLFGGMRTPGLSHGADLDSVFEELQRELQGVLGGQSPPDPGQLGQSSARSEQFRMESGPGGVRVFIDETIDGETTTREFEAASLEELLAAHPELRDHIAKGRGMGLSDPRMADASARIRELLESLRANPSSGLDGDASGGVPTHVLGVLTRPFVPGDDVKGVPLGVGLVIDRTYPGTIAHVLGIHRGDVLLEINGMPVGRGQDVTRILAERKPEENVTVTLLDARGERYTKTWKPTLEGEKI